MAQTGGHDRLKAAAPAGVAAGVVVIAATLGALLTDRDMLDARSPLPTAAPASETSAIGARPAPPAPGPNLPPALDDGSETAVLPVSGPVEGPSGAAGDPVVAVDEPLMTPQGVGKPGPSAPGPQQAQVFPGIKPPAVGSSLPRDAEIVIKFADAPAVDAIVKQFWKDPEGARRAFLAYAAKRPEFSDMVMDRATYSGEIVLRYAPAIPAGDRASRMRSLASKLKTVPDIVYAEPEFTAHPGGE